MKTYLIVAETARTFALRNKATGQLEHGGFISRKLAADFFDLHFAWRTDADALGPYRLESRS